MLLIPLFSVLFLTVNRPLLAPSLLDITQLSTKARRCILWFWLLVVLPVLLTRDIECWNFVVKTRIIYNVMFQFSETKTICSYHFGFNFYENESISCALRNSRIGYLGPDPRLLLHFHTVLGPDHCFLVNFQLPLLFLLFVPLLVVPVGWPRMGEPGLFFGEAQTRLLLLLLHRPSHWCHWIHQHASVTRS